MTLDRPPRAELNRNKVYKQLAVDWLESPSISRLTGNRKAVRAYKMSDLKPRLKGLLNKGFEAKDLEDGTAVLTRAQRSLLVPIRTAYHQFLQHHRKQLCFLDTITLMKIDKRVTKGEIALLFEEMGLKVRSLIDP